MKVRDIMTTDIPTIHADTKVTDVARIVLERGLPGLPVVDDAGRVLGVVTHTDLVAKHARVHMPRYIGLLGAVIALDRHRTDEELRHALGVTAADLMTAESASVSPDAEVDDAASLMVEESADPLLVLENGRLVGVLTQANVIRLLLIEETDDSQSGAT
jgi:CBS domain-containing protein